ncbi:MAG: hypothetical protein ACREO4_10470 [Lysobacter sp.]
MNIRTVAVVLPMLLVIGASCDRRDAEPIEPSETTDTVVDDTAATAPTSTIPSATESCAGLTGDAETDCLTRATDEAVPAAPPVEPAQQTGGDAPAG